MDQLQSAPIREAICDVMSDEGLCDGTRHGSCDLCAKIAIAVSPVPLRIQLRRTAGWRMPPNPVSCARPSRWSNFYRIGDPHPTTGEPSTRADVVLLYREHVIPHAFIISDDLRGKNLGCFCKLCDQHKDGKPLGVQCDECDLCHVDVLLELANTPPTPAGA